VMDRSIVVFDVLDMAVSYRCIRSGIVYRIWLR